MLEILTISVNAKRAINYLNIWLIAENKLKLFSIKASSFVIDAKLMNAKYNKAKVLKDLTTLPLSTFC